MQRAPRPQTGGVAATAVATGDAPQSFPLAPLVATLAVQTVATGAAYSIPAVAPVVARDLGLNPALVGIFVSIVYGVGIVSALLAPGLIYRRGAVRVCQAVLLATVAMLTVAALGTAASVVLAAVLMGLAYGATAPSSTHLLVPRTPPRFFNVVLSLRQIGVPLGGMLAGLIMPTLALRAGWQNALLLQLLPVLTMMLVMEAVRSRWDQPVAPSATGPRSVGLRDMARLLSGNRALQRLSLLSFVYSGMQICFMAFMTTHLTTVVGVDLVRAGQVLAAYQLAGIVSRPIWGWLADRFIAAKWLLALMGVFSCAAAILAGNFAPSTPVPMLFLVCSVAGATASGFTGIAYAEYARLGGGRRTEATGLGSAFMFAGVLVLPPFVSVMVTLLGGYAVAYGAIGVMALACGVLMALGREERAA